MNSEIIEAAVARIEAKLDMALERARDHEERLREIEKATWMKRGGLMLLGAIFAFLGNLLTKLGVHIG